MKTIATLFIIAALSQYLAIERLATISHDAIRITGFILTVLIVVCLFLWIAIRLLTRRQPRTWHDREHITPARRRPLEFGQFPNHITRD